MPKKQSSRPDTADDDARFELNLMQAFKKTQVAAHFREALAPLIAPLSHALNQNTTEVASLRAQLAERDETIQQLQDKVQDLEIKIDDLEQHGRKGSIRVFGLPEDSPGSLDDKLLTLFNDNMEVVPPLCLSDIEVAHRLGKEPKHGPAQMPSAPQGDEAETQQPRAAAQSSQPPEMPPVKPRSIIVK